MRTASTQGLIYLDGFLYESTGITGRSSVRKVRLETGEIIQRRAVNPARLRRRPDRVARQAGPVDSKKEGK